jgi:hypothetical protein
VPVVEQQALAWNPSAPGVKTEDTVLLTPRGLEVLTTDGVWPSTPNTLGCRVQTSSCAEVPPASELRSQR